MSTEKVTCNKDATNVDDFEHKRRYDIYEEVADPAGKVYGYLR